MPNANSGWRKRFRGSVEELADQIHFTEWLHGLDEENKNKVFGEFAEEAWNSLEEKHPHHTINLEGFPDLD